MQYLANFRRLTAVEILDATFQLYRAQFAPMVLIAVLVMLPTALLMLISPPELASAVQLGGNLLLPIGQGAIALAVIAALSGSPIGVTEAFRRVRGRIGNLVGLMLVSGILVVIGFALLVVPGLLALAWTSVALPVLVVEELDAGGALSRARHLARGYIGHVLGTLMLAWIMFVVLVMGGAFGMGVLAGVVGIGQRGAVLLFQAMFAIVYPPLAIATTLLYLDLRVRRDGADIEALAAQLPVAAPVAPSAPTAG